MPREESGKRDPATGQLQGGIPGHEGAFGRVPTELRERLRGSAAERIAVLEHEMTVDHSFTGLFAVLSQMPPENLKKLEAMDDKELEGTLGFLLGHGRQDAADQLVAKIKALQAAQEYQPPAKPARLPRPQRLDPEREVKPAPDPEAVIAVFEDRGTGIKTQEPPEIAEAVAESATEPEPTTQRAGWPPPGRGFVSRESLRNRFL